MSDESSELAKFIASLPRSVRRELAKHECWWCGQKLSEPVCGEIDYENWKKCSERLMRERLDMFLKRRKA